MNNINPYASPPPASDAAGENILGKGESITASFVLSEEQLIETLTRYRLQNRSRRIWQWLRYAVAFVLLACAGVFLMTPDYDIGGFVLMCALSVSMFVSHLIDNYLARRTFRKSPEFNCRQTIVFSEDKVSFHSDVQESTLKWTAFTDAVIFDDGVLIFQGPKIVDWFGFRNLQKLGEAVMLRNLVESKIPGCRSM